MEKREMARRRCMQRAVAGYEYTYCAPDQQQQAEMIIV
jgi:hypothetical protein